MKLSVLKRKINKLLSIYGDREVYLIPGSADIFTEIYIRPIEKYSMTEDGKLLTMNGEKDIRNAVFIDYE